MLLLLKPHYAPCFENQAALQPVLLCALSMCAGLGRRGQNAICERICGDKWYVYLTRLCEMQCDDDGCTLPLVYRWIKTAGTEASICGHTSWPYSCMHWISLWHRLQTHTSSFLSICHAGSIACATMCYPFRWKINYNSFISKGSRSLVLTLIGQLCLYPTSEDNPFKYRRQPDPFYLGGMNEFII